MTASILAGDCLAVLPTLAAASLDACVTDPPYHFGSIVKRFGAESAAPAKVGKTGAYERASRGFMGKKWDGGDIAFQPETWAAVLRVLKPGAHMLAFGGTKGFHRMACAIEDAGFEIRDTIMWLYGSGFPKSHNQHGEWEGWGTALKPAYEPILLVRKSLMGTVAANLTAHKVGAVNIDECRVSGEPWKAHRATGLAATKFFTEGEAKEIDKTPHDRGRWPANIIHDGSDEVVEALPDARGQIAEASNGSDSRKTQNVYGDMKRGSDAGSPRDTGGSAARFFYCAKASRKDREEGCEGLPLRQGGIRSETSGQHITRRDGGDPGLVRNNHPTVKPTELMRYLCRLITPPGGTILDPFTGSGSTGKAALAEGFNFIGIEREAEYLAIARKRLGLPAVSDVSSNNGGVFD